MPINRKIEAHLRYLANKYPVITITGPRQAGKTFLAKKIFSDRPYINLENPDDRAFAKNDPRAFLEEFKTGAIIDEVQRAPELFSYIQALIDEKKQNGFFILTGSQNFLLLEKISQSLAGRTSITNLLPLSLEELLEADSSDEKLKLDTGSFAWDEFMYRGFYPKIIHENIEPNFYYSDYVATYLERDLRDLTSVHDLELFRRFMKLCAVRVGQELNYKNISDDLGTSPNTVKNWVNLLITSHVIFLLPPYFTNIKKRLVKSPKLYFCDVGLAANLLNIENKRQISSHPLYGMLFENMIIMEALKYRFNRGYKSNLYFYGDKGHEVDLLLTQGHQVLALEIKSSKTMHDSFFKNLHYLKTILPETVLNLGVVHGGEKSYQRSLGAILNPWSLLKFLDLNLDQ